MRFTDIGRSSALREPFCALSHGMGALLSLAGLIALSAAALTRQPPAPRLLAGAVIFGASLVLLYSSSALYHGLRAEERGLIRLQRLDHAAIFVLIAGTYAPFCLGPLYGPWGWTLLTLEYAAVLVGGYLALFRAEHTPAAFRVVLYLLMGWAVAAAPGPMRTLLTPTAAAWLVAGGLAYTVGAVVFATDRPHLWPGRFSAHDLWHVFVLAGSACHFVAVWSFTAAA